MGEFQPLRDRDLHLISKSNWHVFERQVVIAIASAWNGGQDAAEIASAHGTTLGTITSLLGRLNRIGVELRPSRWAPPARVAAPIGADANIERLRRLAPYDAIAARALRELNEPAA